MRLHLEHWVMLSTCDENGQYRRSPMSIETEKQSAREMRSKARGSTCARCARVLDVDSVIRRRGRRVWAIVIHILVNTVKLHSCVSNKKTAPR